MQLKRFRKSTLLKNMVLFTCLIFSSQNLLCDLLNIKVLDANQQPLPNLLVYLTPHDSVTKIQNKLQNDKDENTQIQTVFQSDLEFIPHISVIEINSTVQFVNKDKITHHIYSASALNRFSFRIKKSMSKTINNFNQTGPILMGCNIHDWMSGYLFVVDNPWYSMTNVLGESTINIKNSGQFKLHIWHPYLDRQDQQYSRVFDSSQEQSFNIQLTHPLIQEAEVKLSDDLDFLNDY